MIRSEKLPLNLIWIIPAKGHASTLPLPLLCVDLLTADRNHRLEPPVREVDINEREAGFVIYRSSQPSVRIRAVLAIDKCQQAYSKPHPSRFLLPHRTSSPNNSLPSSAFF
ncbi:uncharacterized protein K444DRAFT_315402 [Hyaloscypha bicolor E]|uniref:Uncharacterized protein n=1 Tax=Hyaloscypha bicolor E TaxID=1095630 RepID=A0A2J6TLE9_9HELO|nr:uncharacterized protein K444DRAFT_315402 [Hyaloscypha bicolor E]PMD63855.1 hypothetical protein K444DRAFT_315402 [Hyaloscypha bicolor E]